MDNKKLVTILLNDIAELEELIGKTIRFQREDQYEQEQFDVVLL